MAVVFLQPAQPAQTRVIYTVPPYPGAVVVHNGQGYQGQHYYSPAPQRSHGPLVTLPPKPRPRPKPRPKPPGPTPAGKFTILREATILRPVIPVPTPQGPQRIIVTLPPRPPKPTPRPLPAPAPPKPVTHGTVLREVPVYAPVAPPKNPPVIPPVHGPLAVLA
ncbi:hypothetical protein F5Y04DRAFT_282008 [Hypomontagnella monticulosa]|nr:hypothetical protein F5Y04DRAFT_282008 [Hypomontagnella monticulosa]